MVYLGKGGQIPYLNKSKIIEEVEDVLKNSWDGEFPVDIEKICDDLGINIFPIPDLYKTFSIDAYISSDFKTIYVDGREFEKESYRYRFSVTHELGHFILHKKYYPKGVDNIKDWLKVSQTISSDHAEFQANYFAGNLLVPEDELADTMNHAFNGSFARNYWNASIGEKEKILLDLKHHFKVSGDVLARRIRDVFPGIGRRG